MTARRDIYFQGFAKLLIQDINKVVDFYPTYEDQLRAIQSGVSYDSAEALERLETLIAQRVYDLMQSAFIDIYNAQMHLHGVSVHPNAMLRAVEDLTQWPPKERD